MNTRIGKFILVALLIGLAMALYKQYVVKPRKAKHGASFLTYVQQNNCARTGAFAGRYNEPVYRCDNGPWLQSEIWEAATPQEK